MKIGALQQDSIPETVSQSQINTNRCVYIGKYFFKSGFYNDLLHNIPLKNPATCAGFNYLYINSSKARHLTMLHHQPLLFVLIIFISIANMGEKLYLGKFFCWRTFKKNLK